MVLLIRLDCPRFGREYVLHGIAFDYPQTHFRGVPSRNADTRLTGFSRRESPHKSLRQHRTIPALRLKHRSGGCGTSLAVSALRIMRYCPNSQNRKSPGLFWPGLDGCGAECDLFASADREVNPLRVPPAPSGGRRAAHRGIPGYGPPRSGRKQNLPGCCCWGR